MAAFIVGVVLALNVEFGLDVSPRLFVAIASVESGFNPGAVSRKGALGLMQVMPVNWRRFGCGDWRDPEQNVRAAYRLWISQKYRYDVFLALCEYFAGQEFVDSRLVGLHPDLGCAADYAYRVLEAYEGVNLAAAVP